jgi:hypothetical protein
MLPCHSSLKYEDWRVVLSVPGLLCREITVLSYPYPGVRVSVTCNCCPRARFDSFLWQLSILSWGGNFSFPSPQRELGLVPQTLSLLCFDSVPCIFQISCHSVVFLCDLVLRTSVCSLFFVIQTLIHGMWWRKLLLLYHFALWPPILFQFNQKFMNRCCHTLRKYVFSLLWKKLLSSQRRA